MKHKVKWTGLLTAIICLVPLLTGVFGLSENAKAAGETVSVTLHKKKIDEFPNTAIANTGKEMNEFDHYQGLPGVTFTAWDVTEDFYSKLGLTGSETDAVAKTKTEALMQTFVLDKGNATNVASDVTDANGNVTFPTLEKRTAGGIYKVYYFEETLPAGYTTYSNPIILVLPAMDGANELSTIHLYPKNKIDDKEKPEKILVDEAGKALEGVPAGETFYTFEVGKRINYKASFTFPSQIGEILTEAGVEQTRYNKFVLDDQVSQKGVKFEGIDQIVIGGTAVTPATFLANATDDYYNTAAPFTGYAGFNIAMNLTGAAGPATAQYLSQYAGQRIEFYYTVSFTDETPVDLDINNEFTVTMNHDGGQDDVKTNDPIDPIITGGKKFFKHEDGETKGLAGAEFVVIREVNGVEQYLTVGTDSKTWTPVGPNEDYANATKFISDADGRFEVTGLAYGDYMLREIKAPNGFQKLTDDVDFEIDKDSYNNATALPIANSSKGGTLPSTGGMGIIAFIVIGLGLMAAAIVRYRRVRFEV